MELLGRNDHCWCGSGHKYKKCHMEFDEKLESLRRMGCIVPSHKIIKTPEQIEGIRQSARINIAVLDYVAQHIQEGVTTEEIDRWVYEQTAVQTAERPTNQISAFFRRREARRIRFTAIFLEAYRYPFNSRASTVVRERLAVFSISG